MINSIHDELVSQVSQMIRSHIDQLNQFAPLGETVQITASSPILQCIKRLEQICTGAPETCPDTLLAEAVDCLAAINEFLTVTGQEKNSDFDNTLLGGIYMRGLQWSRGLSRASLASVWKSLEPAIPDCLAEVEPNVYQASWWMPVPVMDIEILRRTPGVTLRGEPFEPAHLPNGLAVRFSLLPTQSEN